MAFVIVSNVVKLLKVQLLTTALFIARNPQSHESSLTITARKNILSSLAVALIVIGLSIAIYLIAYANR